MDALRTWLPRGDTLPLAVWARRHGWLVALAWAHVPILFAFGLLRGHPVAHALLDVAPIAAFALLAGRRSLTRSWRAAACCLGLLSASAALVHVCHGQTEAHFHFFVMVTLCAIYQAWFPYLLAFAFVVAHHLVMGLWDPSGVYGHEGSPLVWAGVHGGFIAMLGVANLVSWRLNEDAWTEATEAGERFQSAFDDAPTGMAITGMDDRIERVNSAFAAVVGYEADALVGRSLSELTQPLPGGDEAIFTRSDGTTGWALLQRSTVHDTRGRALSQVTHMVDISTRKHAESQLDHQAHHDALTGLPNRTYFAERLAAALGEGAVGVLFVDLDEFKLINDSLGHSAGDRLLVAVAVRLRGALRSEDVVARLGGDEFAVLLPGLRDEADAHAAAARITGCLRPPIMLNGQQRYVTASVGLRCGGADVTPEELLRDADAAMYRAKALGKARAEIFDPSMHVEVQRRLELESDLRHATARGELLLHYQPQVDLRTGRIAGVEALVRWEHPRLGLIPPLGFIPLAEQSGLIVHIGTWVLREACTQAIAWPELEMSVNVSARQLADPGFPDLVAGVLAETGLPPRLLCLEVTETAVISDPTRARAGLVSLQTLGVRLAIDDFGVGQSSLGQLRTMLPVDTLKIDKSFVDALEETGQGRAIVDAVVQLTRSLGMRAVAEGVETSSQASALRGLDCALAQGYHFARPVEADEVSRLLAGEPSLAA
jgi:diguanylate cyclase (GGDEF)-like protein